MCLNGILFLGLNFVANFVVNPGSKRSKKVGYALILSVILAYTGLTEYKTLLALEFHPKTARNLLFGGFVLPVLSLSLVYYRIKKNRIQSK